MSNTKILKNKRVSGTDATVFGTLANRSWDSRWEKVFQNRAWGKYPSEELVRFIARNFYKAKDREKIRILDLGCGTGAGAWFIAREGFSSFGIDGSETAIKIATERFRKENLKGEFLTGDIIKLKYPNNYFDCIIDICALQHNRNSCIKQIIKEMHRVLKHNGKIFSMIISKKSRVSKKDYLKEYGFTNFMTENDIRKAFCRFGDIEIEKKERTDRGNLIAHFIVSVTKRN
ncbi:MAG: methyltransferase domain-containing protein [Candidatus Woesearchaeota archaeon]|nr:methyltransferase domain-containing protein [Candidatus Woesearchaeota archaeon]